MNVRLNVGDPAPNFTLKKAGGGTISLVDLRGAQAIVWFYPAANTSLCTKQACDLRDHAAELTQDGTRIVGISPDGLEDIERFVNELHLPFEMASDPTHQVMEAYGAWGEKNMYGVVKQGVIRSTFVIDEEGKVMAAKYRVGTPKHIDFLRTSLAK